MEILLCLVERVLIILNKSFSLVFREQILFKPTISLFLLIDFQTQVVILDEWDGFEFKNYYLVDNGIQNILMVRILITALHQQNGFFEI